MAQDRCASRKATSNTALRAASSSVVRLLSDRLTDLPLEVRNLRKIALPGSSNRSRSSGSSSNCTVIPVNCDVIRVVSEITLERTRRRAASLSAMLAPMLLRSS